MRTWLLSLIVVGSVFVAQRLDAEEAGAVRLAVFEVDASPPVGSPLAYDTNIEVQNPLSCRGIVLLPPQDQSGRESDATRPIVLCAVDWIGIGNAAHREFREALAKAAGTSASRVAVHTLHQHDAPWCDFTADELVAKYKISHRPFDSVFARDVLRRASAAVKDAIGRSQPVTHVGLSSTEVKYVASNRRILGPDGKVLHVRYTATKDAKIREFPEGTIDPLLRMITFWNGEEPLAALSYYATHPQSYYRTGKANPDFPGLARNARQQSTGVPHIHFNGAGGNIGAGKYNDGSPENRQILADRVGDAMQRAWNSTKKSPLAAADVRWTTTAVALPPAPHLDEKTLVALVEGREPSSTADKGGEAADAKSPMPLDRFIAATKLAWLRRCQEGEKTELACLRLGGARILHLPGELFVEYQLESQRLRPDAFIAVAAYGDYGPAYIGTEISYAQGGYETGRNSSFVAPEVEGLLMRGIAKLLDADPVDIRPLR
ncbi:MAG TPA: hypothetical protein VJ809_03050 [Pirellulales bacterium]|nr:hypothetical protein [Pirellulales bacterium]